MNQIIIQHEPNSQPAKFRVVRGRDHKLSDPVEVVSPRGYPVEGRPMSDLLGELRWYLEQFLIYPFPPETEHADRVQEAMRNWGRQSFGDLFGGGRGRDFLQDAVRETGHSHLNLQISSDNPQILAWPWEALEDVETGALAHLCQIERRINAVADPLPLPNELPQDRVNILLITARPFERDVDYQSISRPLVELVAKQQLPADVTLLRPPTFEQLEEELKRRPGHYHVVHFDGHGGYGDGSTPGPHQMLGTQGRLIFEDENGRPSERTASQLAVLLREYRIPAVVLNACQSAMLDERAEDVFASVAVSLLKAGIRSVVAMSYILYVTAAKEFLPAFYRCLFEYGDFSVATRAGRRRLLEQPKRLCARGRHPLQDWLVPVHYQQDEFKLPFVDTAAESTERIDVSTFIDDQTPYGFIGRDGPILALERALHRRPSVLLIQGLGGVGKTALAHGFIQWLIDTKGVAQEHIFWFRFDQIHSAEYVVNRIIERLFDSNDITLPLTQKLEMLQQVCQTNRFLMVWDNFEVVWGIPGTSVRPQLSVECREVLARLVKNLSGTPTKIVMTSRGDEDWLERPLSFKLPLSGLTGEERWEFCEEILANTGLNVDRDNAELAKLIEELDGHPLAMRVVLPHLESRSAEDVLNQLRESPTSFDNVAESKLFTTLQLAEELIPRELRPLLEPLSLHERFVVADGLAQISGHCNANFTDVDVYRCLRALSGLGVLIDRGQGIFEIHGMFSRYLRAAHAASMDWQESFVASMGELASPFAYKDVNEQESGLKLYLASFQGALQVQSDDPETKSHQLELMKTLGRYFQNIRYPDEAKHYFFKLEQEAGEDLESKAYAYHHLGLVAQFERDLTGAEDWFKKSLAISKACGMIRNVSNTCLALAELARVRRDFTQQQEWSSKAQLAEMGVQDFDGESDAHLQIRKALSMFSLSTPMHAAILESIATGDFTPHKEMMRNRQESPQTPDPLAASNFFNKGVSAFENQRYDEAEQLFLEAIKVSDESGTAKGYHELGMVCRRRGELDSAEQWLQKALALKGKLNDEKALANTLQELGNLDLVQEQYESADGFYKRALELFQKIEDSCGEGHAFAGLGNVSQLQGDFSAAEKWYMSALTNFYKLEDWHLFAHTRGRLGTMYGAEAKYIDSATCLIEAMVGLHMTGDGYNATLMEHNLREFYKKASANDQMEIRSIWDSFPLGSFPDDLD